MCGIIGAFNHGENTKPVNEDILDILQDQISRGKEGFGISFISKDKKVDTKRTTLTAKAIIDLYQKSNQSPMAIMHHRMPTSSENKISQTHPIKVENNSLKYKYLVIHNGVVRNCDTLRKKHKTLGFIYTTTRMKKWFQTEEEEYNDSEAFAIELARYVENQTEEMNIMGSVAFIALQINKNENTVKKVFFGRNESNPLKLSTSKGKIRLSSEGKGDNIKPFHLYSFTLANFKITKQKLKFKEKVEKLPYTTNFLAENNAKDTTTVRGYEIKTDIPRELSEAFDTNVIAAEELLSDYFEVLGDENKMLAEDLDSLLKDTTKGLLLELREAKNRATDAFSDLLLEEAEEEKLLRENEIIEENLTGDNIEKRHAG